MSRQEGTRADMSGQVSVCEWPSMATVDVCGTCLENEDLLFGRYNGPGINIRSVVCTTVAFDL